MIEKMTTFVYGVVVTMMIAVAFLAAADILVPGNAALVGAMVFASVAAIAADLMYFKPRRMDRELAAA